MINTTRFLVLATALAVAAVPAVSFGATFAYVNQENEIRTMTADTALIALATAPNIHIHSGVIQLDDVSEATTLQN
jgi:hypothetical protein